MLSVKAREAADTIFKVFSMTQLRIKPSLLWLCAYNVKLISDY